MLGKSTDVRYITILRDPVDQFESMYNYVHFNKIFHVDLEQFVATYVQGGKKVDRLLVTKLLFDIIISDKETGKWLPWTKPAAVGPWTYELR